MAMMLAQHSRLQVSALVNDTDWSRLTINNAKTVGAALRHASADPLLALADVPILARSLLLAHACLLSVPHSRVLKLLSDLL